MLRRVYSMQRLWDAISLRQLGEADGVVVHGEDRVDILHETVTEQPDIATKTNVLASEGANAFAAANCAKVEARWNAMRFNVL